MLVFLIVFVGISLAVCVYIVLAVLNGVRDDLAHLQASFRVLQNFAAHDRAELASMRDLQDRVSRLEDLNPISSYPCGLCKGFEYAFKAIRVKGTGKFVPACEECCSKETCV